jgi:uncharacterized membrane protein
MLAIRFWILDFGFWKRVLIMSIEVYKQQANRTTKNEQWQN